MDFDVGKCKIIQVGSRHRKLTYKMAGTALTSANQQKNLGVNYQ